MALEKDISVNVTPLDDRKTFLPAINVLPIAATEYYEAAAPEIAETGLASLIEV